jgi:hypothetical protein
VRSTGPPHPGQIALMDRATRPSVRGVASVTRDAPSTRRRKVWRPHTTLPGGQRRADFGAAFGQQKGSKHPKSSLSNHPQISCQSAQTRMNRTIARQWSPISLRWNNPVTPEVAGSSPVAPIRTPCIYAIFVVAFENVIVRPGSKRSKTDAREAVHRRRSRRERAPNRDARSIQWKSRMRSSLLTSGVSSAASCVSCSSRTCSQPANLSYPCVLERRTARNLGKAS